MSVHERCGSEELDLEPNRQAIYGSRAGRGTDGRPRSWPGGSARSASRHRATADSGVPLGLRNTHLALELTSMRVVVIVPLLFLLTTSCATIIASGPDAVPVNSEPEGARVLLDGQAVGRTPLTASLSRKCEGVLTFQLDGYETRVVDLDKVVNGWIFGNIIFGGLIGIAVDLITSNQGKYSTSPVFVELVPRESTR